MIEFFTFTCRQVIVYEDDNKTTLRKIYLNAREVKQLAVTQEPLSNYRRVVVTYTNNFCETFMDVVEEDIEIVQQQGEEYDI